MPSRAPASAAASAGSTRDDQRDGSSSSPVWRPREGAEEEDAEDGDATPERAPAPSRMKKSCEGCSRSKVRCSGTRPCERCVRRGDDCAFLHEAKRGRRSNVMKAALAAQALAQAEQPAPVARVTRKRSRPKGVGTEYAARDALALWRVAAPPGSGAAQPAPALSEPAPPPVSLTTLERMASAFSAAHAARPVFGPPDAARAAQACWTQTSRMRMPVVPELPGADELTALDPRVKRYERRLLRVFFALYKHHFNGESKCCRQWFSARIIKLKWLAAHDVPLALVLPDSPPPRDASVLRPPPMGSKAPHFSDIPPPRAAPGAPELAPPGAAAAAPAAGCALDSSAALASGDATVLRLRRAVDRNAGDPRSDAFLRVFATHEGAFYECNERFVSLTGYTAYDAFQMTRWAHDGFLPWGGDAYAMLAESDEAVLQFLRLCSVNFARLGLPAASPATRRVDFTADAVVVPRSGSRKLATTMSVSVIESLSMERTAVDVTLVLTYAPPDLGARARAAAAAEPGSEGGSDGVHFLNPDAPRFDDDAVRMRSTPAPAPLPPNLDRRESEWWEASSAGREPSLDSPVNAAAGGGENDAWLNALLHWVDERQQPL